MNLIRKRIQATRIYDIIFNAVEEYACKKMNVSNLSEMMLKFTQEVLDETDLRDKDKILLEAKYKSGDYLENMALAAVSDSKECQEALSYMQDSDEFLHSIEAQVQVKAHQPENLKASEELIEKFLKENKQ